jgi:hypothetical protein
MGPLFGDHKSIPAPPVRSYRVPMTKSDMDMIKLALKTAAVISRENGHLTQAEDFRGVCLRFELNSANQLRR